MTDDDLGQAGSPDDQGIYPGQKPDNIKFIGTDKAVIELKRENGLHWTEQEAMGFKTAVFSPREYGDNDKSSPEQNMEEEDV